MGLGIWHSCRKLHNFYFNGYEFREHGIACALRWGVALIGDFLYWPLLTPSWENQFFFRYWRYSRKLNRFKKLVKKKARFGFILYPINFG